MESSNGQYAKHDIENPGKGQKERRSSMTKIALTGIKPTGTPHIGNYLGMIKPASNSLSVEYHLLQTDFKNADEYLFLFSTCLKFGNRLIR